MAEHREELYDIYSHSKFYERFYALYDTLTVTMTGYGEKLDFRGLSMGEKMIFSEKTGKNLKTPLTNAPECGII